MNQPRRPSRPLLLSLVSALVLVVAVVGLVIATQPPRKEPFFGPHQAGITTTGQKFAFVAAFDVTAADAAGLRDLWKGWTRTAEALTQGLPLGPVGPRSAPPADTGEVLSYKPARLTLTFGAGPSLFDHRFGLAERRPRALVPFPRFSGDALDPAWSDGDLVVQVGADDYQTAYHALHTLVRQARGSATLRWVQDGFQPGLEVNTSGPGRNLQGFLDGTKNPDTQDPAVMDRVVWAEAPDWMAGGSYLVVRRIRMFVETWDRTGLADQERSIGRDRARGEELPAMAEDSHVRLARGAGAEQILRRPFHYVAGLDARTGQLDAGLVFLAWMKDPGRQFVPMQTRLSSSDLLNEYIRPVGSALFAVFPGVEPGSYLGASLLPEPPLVDRIEALLGQVGALYPALGRGDWVEVRSGAARWTQSWSKESLVPGAPVAAIEALRKAWVESLVPDAPDPAAVRAAQAALVTELTRWEASVRPRPQGSATDLQPLKAAIASAQKALAANDVAAARQAFEGFQKGWLTKEALVRSLDAGAYGFLEGATGTARRALAAEPPTAAAAEALGAIATRLDTLAAPRSFGAWDVAFLLFREGLEALLVLAALLGFLAKTGQAQRAPWVWAGAGLGLAASVAVAAVLSLLLSGWSSMAAPTLVEAITGLVAVALMLTVGAWLHGKANIKNWNLWLKEKMGKAGTNPWALGALALLSVLREGAETVVFLWGLAGQLTSTDLVLGVGGALLVLTVLGVAMLGFSKRLPLQWFFPLATGLIYFLAAKILGQSLGYLQVSGWWPATPLGFGGPVDFLGFVPTWETALPQVLLALTLGTLLVRSLVSHGPKKG